MRRAATACGEYAVDSRSLRAAAVSLCGMPCSTANFLPRLVDLALRSLPRETDS
jgi:hypothetical protein